MRTDYSIECVDSAKWIQFSPYVSVMLTFVCGLPAVILFYIFTHRRHLHSKVVKERIGFLYERFNGGAEAWEVHEILRKAFLTGAIVFIEDPVLQAASACVMCTLAVGSLNYFRPHKNKVLFDCAGVLHDNTRCVCVCNCLDGFKECSQSSRKY